MEGVLVNKHFFTKNDLKVYNPPNTFSVLTERRAVGKYIFI